MSEDKGTPALDAAIVKLQGILPRVAKGATGQVAGKKDYKYADLADVSEAILPLLSKCGLAFTAMPDMQDGLFGLRYKLRHASGESDGGFYLLPDPRQTGAQQVGSAITYARRYSLCSATGVAPDGDDDDAGAAQGGFRGAGDAFESAAPAAERQQWRPREAATAGGARAEGTEPGTRSASQPQGSPEGEGAFVAKFYVDLAEAKGESVVRVLQTDVGKAIRAGVITAPVGNELLVAARERMTEVRSAA